MFWKVCANLGVNQFLDWWLPEPKMKSYGKSLEHP